MAAIKMNGVTYETDSLSDDVKGHLRHLAHIDQEFERLHMKMDVLRIARAEIGARLDNDLLRAQINDAVFVGNKDDNKLDASA